MRVQKAKRIQLTAAAVTVGALILTTTSSAASATTGQSKSGEEYFVIGVAGDTESAIVHGLFAGGGRDDNSHDEYDILHLGGGTVRVNHPDAQSTFTDKIDPTTCFVTFNITGKYTLSNGTGRFKGVSGHGNYQVSEQGILAREKDGSCSQTQEPLAEAGSITGHGPATLP